MKLLLDTHTFLWAIWGDSRLSKQATKEYLDSKNELYFSTASYWEICIKHSIDKLTLASNWQTAFDQEMAINGIRWLAIAKEHCQGIISLPKIHGDPFDRLLIAQALHEDMTLVTKDINIAKYSVNVLW